MGASCYLGGSYEYERKLVSYELCAGNPTLGTYVFEEFERLWLLL